MTHALSRRDLDFLLYEWLDVEALTGRERFAEHSRETFDAVLDLTADLADKYFIPHNRLADANEPRMLPDGTVEMIPEVKEAMDAYAESGLIAGTFDQAIGGMQLPTVVARASMAWLQASNAGTAAYPFLTVANAALIAEYGTPEQIETFVAPMLEGRWFGTMCLSEPQAGSSLADITTRAERQDDGTYRVVGSKMWISGGEQELSENIVHLVLAKTPGGRPGVHSISLFIVPKYLPSGDGVGERNDITLTGLNHKMGNRGTTNTALAIGDGTHRPDGQPGAVGYLVGEEHRGLSYMFHMMNEARIGVGFLATSLGYVGYLKAVDYARGRAQGRALGAKDPSSPQVPIIEHADVRRMLLAQKAYVEGGLALGLYCSKLVDDQVTATTGDVAGDVGLLLDVLTPIAKSWPSQWCLKANDLAIQVHGGYGYTRDYDVEQHYRDNRLNPIHEGTHGVQGMDLLGRKVIMQGGRGLALLAERIAATVAAARDAGGDAVRYADQLEAAWQRIVEVTAALWADGDATVALANSSVYLEAFGHVVVAWIWLEQLVAVGGRAGDFYDGKRMAARYFYAHELPQVGPWIDLLASKDTTTVEMNPNWF
ncbi:acyl-CoA dehydrogenase [Gordonia sp. (in: high G+C Gram-positive bacteria)]|uniref:acyl-CoA dehydrogenase n=1 Tax=Gordonia sp. (in: high G+C Gram-positive bacteria) TaxID=84139 RepID=UPI00168F5D93|nr:acyl-CoA dehydrogenase [Gordonia sp. (in: high G+C Gram-positive bacteria)]NLG47835.1 acyl-CoA dehydrogenase [Gordonia sp. (in: high G+C Gram-positive bacteria)]